MPDNRLHDMDVYTWTGVHAGALCDVAAGRRSNAVGGTTVIGEIESSGGKQEHALESYATRMISHPLKRPFFPADLPEALPGTLDQVCDFDWFPVRAADGGED